MRTHSVRPNGLCKCVIIVDLEGIADTKVKSRILPLEVVNPSLAHRRVGVVELNTPVQTQNYEGDIDTQAKTSV